MSCFRTSFSQRIAAALALLGVLAYATLVPWHLSTRQAERSVERTLVAAQHAMCLPGVTSSAAEPGAPPVPVENETSCPICKGLAAFHVAVLPAAAAAALPDFTVGAAFYATSDDRVARQPGIVPRSRGPPAA